MADIIVDTYKLNQYAQRLSDVNAKIVKLDWRLDRLYSKVGLAGLWNLIQADALTGYSWRILRCKLYMQQTASEFEKAENYLSSQDPTNFKKPASSVSEAVFEVGAAVKKGAEKIKSSIRDTIYNLAYDYYSKGTVYKYVQYGKAVLKAAKGVGKIALGVGSLIGTAGLTTHASLLTILSGANDVYNSIIDATYAYVEDYDKIGKTNFLKDKLVNGGNAVGRLIGNEALGEAIGRATYYGIDLVTSLAVLNCSMDKLKDLSSTNLGQLGKELKEIGSLDVSNLFTTSMENIKYQVKLAGYTYTATANFVSNAGVLIKIGKNAVKVGKGLNNVLSANRAKAYDNPVIGFYDKASGINDKIGKGIKAALKITKKVFG